LDEITYLKINNNVKYFVNIIRILLLIYVKKVLISFKILLSIYTIDLSLMLLDCELYKWI